MSSAYRYPCKVQGCSKSFQRLEHLTRHAQSHSIRFQCKICEKEFTRNDSLQRHLGLHGEEFKHGTSSRSKRACASCHASKIKCSGEGPCLRCLTKGLYCHYDQPRLQQPTTVLDDPQPSTDAEESPAVSSMESETISSNSSKNEVDTQGSFVDRLSAAFRRNEGPVDWSVIRIEGEEPTGAALNYGRQSPSEDTDWPVLSHSETIKYRDAYFTHFHHRWPILHAPTFELESVPPALYSCITMIGACITGTEQAKNSAMSLHSRVVEWIFSQLKHAVLTKAFKVRSLLVTCLREIGSFDPGKPVPYDKPGYFVPLRLVKESLRQRLATVLFKIDTYLSVLQNEPGFLAPEELYFKLPSTFALSNCDGLDIFQTRHSIEPPARNQRTISEVILDPDVLSISPADGFPLVEDIQLGICAMHTHIWRWHQRPQANSPGEYSSFIATQESLKRRLESWKHWILQSPIQKADHIDFTIEQSLAMRYYYGMESHTQPGWQLIVFDRAKSLILDTLMLYHLLALHLHADIRVLRQLAKETNQPDPECIYGEINLRARAKREESTRAWITSEASRRALTISTDILVSYSNVSGLENRQVDPITYVALSTAALIIWGYCIFGGEGCFDCNAELPVPPGIGPPAELTKWSVPSGPKASQFLSKDRELWIEKGGCRGALTGLVLCRCNVKLLVGKFRACIREGWEAADSVAPGLFNL